MNLSDPKDIHAAKKKAKRERNEQLDDMRVVLSLPKGRRFLWRLLMQCGIKMSVYENESNRMYYKAGQQDLGRFLERELEEADQEAVSTMRKEAQQWSNQQQAQGQEQRPTEQEQEPQPAQEQESL